MSKQLILISAPFNCGHCARAIKECPTICEENGWEFNEIMNEQTKDPNEKLPVDMYPTFMIRVGGEMKEILRGYNKSKLVDTLKKY